MRKLGGTIQYMLLLRGATRSGSGVRIAVQFQYMLLLRGATLSDAQSFHPCSFNTCSSCEEQPPCASKMPHTLDCFNTCSSCEEQQILNISRNKPFKFQYMLLLRGATGARGTCRCVRCFNTCSSCEEQPERSVHRANYHPFQYMLLLRGATWRQEGLVK